MPVRFLSARLLLALLPLLPASGLVAQTTLPERGYRWSVGPLVTVGGGFPSHLVQEYCEATRSHAVGVAGTLVPWAKTPWLGIENELQYVMAPFNVCAIPGLVAEGERQVIEADLSTPFGALNSRVRVELPFGPARVRFHAGGGISLPEFRPIVSRGVGVGTRWGRLGGSVVLDWWTLWPGGDRVHEEWGREGTQRERLGPYDELFHVRFVRFSLSWAIGSGFGG